jgi:hypothetical protein
MNRLALGVVLGASLLFGCGSDPGMTPRQQNALRAARRCAETEYHGKGIHRSRLMLEKGRIEHSDDAGDVVHFPEEQPRGRPMGLTLLVAPMGSKCERLPID